MDESDLEALLDRLDATNIYLADIRRSVGLIATVVGIGVALAVLGIVFSLMSATS